MDFFEELLIHSEGQFANQPFLLDPSQRFIVGCAFGWKRKLTKVAPSRCPRRFHKLYIEQGKGSGKTPLAAGMCLYGLIADGEPGAQIYSAAADGKQAHICFNDAVAMVRGSPELQRRVTIIGAKPVRKLTYIGTSAAPCFFEPRSKWVKIRGSGLRPHMVSLDELHEHDSADTLEVLWRGFKWREQPLMIEITNAGADRESVCWDEHELARMVALGEIENDKLFSYICSLDEGEDPLDLKQDDPALERIWRKTNPLLGTTITFDYVREQVEDALQIPARRNRVLRWYFCQWTDSEEAWIEREVWEACEDASLDEADFAGKFPVWFGIDLSATRDLTVWCTVYHTGSTEDDKPTFAAFCKSYTPGDTLEARMRKDNAPYQAWVTQGWLRASTGIRVDYNQVARDMASHIQLTEARAVAFDKWSWDRFEEPLADALGGLDRLELWEHPQGTFRRSSETGLWMPGSIDALEEAILDKRLRVQPDPVLRMGVSSAVTVENAASNRRWQKRKSTRRIDALVSLTMGFGAAVRGVKLGTEPSGSPWDDPDFDYESWVDGDGDKSA